MTSSLDISEILLRLSLNQTNIAIRWNKKVVSLKLGHECEFSFLNQTKIAIWSARSEELAA